MNEREMTLTLNRLAGNQICEQPFCPHVARRYEARGSRFCLCCYKKFIGSGEREMYPSEFECDGTRIKR